MILIWGYKCVTSGPTKRCSDYVPVSVAAECNADKHGNISSPPILKTLGYDIWCLKKGVKII